MKRSHTLSPANSPRPDRSIARPRGALDRIVTFGSLAAFALVLGTGCVTAGKHETVVAERDALDEKSRALEQQLENVRVSNESLGQELDSLLEELEDERISRSELEGRVASLSDAEKRLSEELSTTSTELKRSKEELARTAAEVEKLNTTYANLVTDLESELAAGQIQIEQLKEGLRVNVADDVLFPPGSAQLDSLGRDVLAKVANQLARLDHHVEVQGHTDNVPIRGKLTKVFPTNWELGAARAARVARLLQEEGVSGDRLIVASFADQRPLAPNDTAEGRAMNRRIEIRLLPLDEPVVDTAGIEGGMASVDEAGEAPPAPGASKPDAPVEPVPASTP